MNNEPTPEVAARLLDDASIAALGEASLSASAIKQSETFTPIIRAKSKFVRVDLDADSSYFAD